MTKFEDGDFPPLNKNRDNDTQPPAHWLSMVQNRAPHLLESDGPFNFTSELSEGELSEGDINPNKISANVNNSQLGYIRRLVILFGELLLHLGQKLVATQTTTPEQSAYEHLERPPSVSEINTDSEGNKQPPAHWLSMVQSKTPLSPTQHLRNLKEPSSAASVKISTESISADLNQDSINKVLNKTGSTSDASDRLPPQHLNSPDNTINQPPVAFGQWLCYLGQIVIDKLRAIFYSKTSRQTHTGGYSANLPNTDEIQVSRVKSKHSYFKTKNRTNANFSNNEHDVDLNGSFKVSLKRLQTIGFSWSMINFGKWLSWLSRLFSLSSSDQPSSDQPYTLNRRHIPSHGADNRLIADATMLLKPSIHGSDSQVSPDESSIKSPKKTNPDRVSFSWPLIKLSAWLSSLGQLFIDGHHALRESTNYKSIDDHRDTAYCQLMETPAERCTDSNSMPSDSFNHFQVSSEPDVVSHSNHADTTPNMLSTELSSSSEIVNSSKPLTSFNNWLSSLIYKFIDKTDATVDLKSNDHFRPLHNVDIPADILSERQINASDDSDKKLKAQVAEHVESMENIESTALSPDYQSLAGATKRERRLSFSSNDHFTFENQQVQKSTWPTLPDEENPDEYSTGIGVAALSEKTSTKMAVEDIVWPELITNSSMDHSSTLTEVEKFNALSTANNSGITKILDTMKERKQRELKGTLWNA